MNVELNLFELALIWSTTLVLILIIKKFTYKNFLEYLDKREEFVNGSIENAKTENENAIVAHQGAKEEKDKIMASRRDILEDANKVANLEKDQIILNTKVQSKKMLETAENRIENEKIKAQEELASELMDMVTLVSSQYIKNNISQEAENKLIKEAIELVNSEA